jgi:hypothetical protein
MYRQKPRCAPFSDESRRESPEKFLGLALFPRLPHSHTPTASCPSGVWVVQVGQHGGATLQIHKRERADSYALWVPNCLNTSAPGYRILKIAPIDHAAHPRVVDGTTVSVAATCLASRAHRNGEEAPDSALEPPRPPSPRLDPSPLAADPATSSIRAEAELNGCPFGTKCVSEGGLEPPCPVKGTSTSS